MTDGSRRVVVAVTSRKDVTADLVVRRLGGGGLPASLHRVDPADIDSGYLRLDARLSAGRWAFTLTDRYRTTASHEVCAVWWRKPLTTTRDEGHAQLEGLLRTLEGVRWISHPDTIARAAHKPVQLLLAHRAGLRVPDVALPGSPEAARSFAKAQAAGAVAKTLAIKGPLRWVTPDWEGRLAEGQPLAVQARVDKAYDVRLTAVGRELFAASVHVPEGVTDWRVMQETAQYRPVDVPAATAEAVLAYLEYQGLPYGALDFAVDREGTWWFLECNPNGQFGFIEHRTGLPISGALARALSAP